MDESIKEYTNGEIKVFWEASKCTHSTNCWRGLISTFNPKKRPWIDLSAEDSELIAKQIELCPSGALTYERMK